MLVAATEGLLEHWAKAPSGGDKEVRNTDVHLTHTAGTDMSQKIEPSTDFFFIMNNL